MVIRPLSNRRLLGLLARLCAGGALICCSVTLARGEGDGAGSNSVANAIEARLKSPVKLEQRCDPAGKFLLFSQPATGQRYLAHLEGSQLALSQPLTGRHDSRGKLVDCRTITEDRSPRDDGYCNSACAYDASGLKYFYSRYHDATRQETATSRERYWLGLELQDGLFLTRNVSRLVSTNLSVSFHWQTQRYEEQIDFQARRFSIRHRAGTDKSKDEPKFEASNLPAVAQGRLLVAASTFDPSLAFTDFQAVHGKDQLKGSSDLSASVMARWDRDSLSFRVAVKDDVVKLGEGIDSDHLELWFTPSVFEFRGIRQKATEEDRQVLISMVDGKVIASLSHPENAEPARPLEGHYEVSAGGYTVEFKVPAALLIAYNRPRWSDYDDALAKVFFEGDVLPFTLVVSDADGSGKQKALIATSALKWGKPATFGRIGLVGAHHLPELNHYQPKEEL
jgi:hypothetical protein